MGLVFVFWAESYQLGLVLLLSLPLFFTACWCSPLLMIQRRAGDDPGVDPAVDPVECVLPVSRVFPDPSQPAFWVRARHNLRLGYFSYIPPKTQENGGRLRSRHDKNESTTPTFKIMRKRNKVNTFLIYCPALLHNKAGWISFVFWCYFQNINVVNVNFALLSLTKII